MKIDLQKLKNSEVELTISLEIEALEKYLKEALNLLRKNTKANGYRTGKVPDNILKKIIGEAQVREEALNLAVSDSLGKAIKNKNLEVFEYSKLEVRENTPSSLSFSVKLLLFPEVVLGNYESIQLKAKPISVEDSEIQKTLDEVRRMRTEFTSSQEPAKDGDRVEINFEVKDKGQIIEGGKSDNHPLVVGKGNFVPGFEDKIKGMTIGEEKSFSLKMPEDYYQKNIAGKGLDFWVKLQKIETPKELILDDALAQSLGNFQNLDDLRASVRAGIMQEKQEKESERLRLAVIDEILKNTKLELPPVLLDRQLDIMMKNFDQELHGRGMEMGLYLAHIKKTQDELRESFKKQAEKQAKTALVMREIGKKESVVVTDEEVTKRLTELNAAINIQEGMLPNETNIEELKSRVRQVLLDEKVFNLLLSRAVIE